MKNIFENIEKHIEVFDSSSISAERKSTLNLLVEYLKNKQANNEVSRLNFICTHNSRRSHLTQIWAQTMAFYNDVKNVDSYSGGTETTAMFPKVSETLSNQGFQIQKLNETENPVYAVKYNENAHPIICFSKKYDDAFNPESKFAAIMTCSQADGGCPFIAGAEKRISIQYEDPKVFDGTDLMNEKYTERSLEIAAEMNYVFSKIKK